MDTLSDCSLPDAQALALLALHELERGNLDSSRYYSDQAVRHLHAAHVAIGPEAKNDDAVLCAVRRDVLYALISLARMIRLGIARVKDATSYAVKRQASTGTDMINPVGFHVNAQVEQLLSWTEPQPFEFSSASLRTGPALSQLTTWVYCFSARAQIYVDDVLPELLLDTYSACLSWYASKLQASKGPAGGSGPFDHMYYHFCVLELFRPFCDLQCVTMPVSPRQICQESAEAVFAMAKACRGAKFDDFDLPCFVPLFLHAAGLIEIDIAEGQARDQGVDMSTTTLASQSDPWLWLGDAVDPLSLGNKAVQQLTELSSRFEVARKLEAALRTALHNRVGSAEDAAR
ncbi:Fungal trans [Emericellopsis cladophorae]|uniref:Fungal trans n=1 Tax=Emericellopsis cladophorae TaxID=2686198 RepID=A0A9P9XW82_9HYPO|nr:Fungal trans [Emericellopsis cladophorae]KAI6778885.1 Fungal trans [Emericellopsis cladophorae]